ncbi:MAG: hypothetical protein V7681_09115 [Halopseudomonas sabulinigri]
MIKPVHAAELPNDVLASVNLTTRGQDLINTVKSGFDHQCYKLVASHMGLDPLELSPLSGDVLIDVLSQTKMWPV